MNPAPLAWKIAIFLLTLLAAAQSYAADLDLVLVAARHSSIASMSAEDVRRLYLGVPLVSGDQSVKPLLNDTDPLLREIFMQQILFMSADAYQRQTISRTYRTGAPPPPTYTDMSELIKALKTDPRAVTYMLRSTAITAPDLKIIEQLWHGQD